MQGNQSLSVNGIPINAAGFKFCLPDSWQFLNVEHLGFWGSYSIYGIAVTTIIESPNNGLKKIVYFSPTGIWTSYEDIMTLRTNSFPSSCFAVLEYHLHPHGPK